MGSLHELKARSCPKPEKPRTLSHLQEPNPNAYFGWQVVRALQNPQPEIQRVGPNAITPNRILSQIKGEHLVYEEGYENNRTKSTEEYRKLKKEREERQKAARELRHRHRG